MITIKGLRINKLSITREGDKLVCSGSYSLISSLDKVLSTNDFNGYNDLAVPTSGTCAKAMDALMLAYKNEISAIVGLDEEKGGEQ